jgi:hypothetical protein
MQSIGFKEWAIVCEALGRGEQHLILRKGGIAEGREGFAFRHREFFLFPTLFHEQIEKVRISGAQLPGPAGDRITVRFFARAEQTAFVTSWETARSLASLHILRPEVVLERFDYNGTVGLQVALVRIFRLIPGWNFPDTPAYGGCRSWVPLPNLPEGTRFDPVISDEEFARTKNEFASQLSASTTNSASSVSEGGS